MDMQYWQFSVGLSQEASDQEVFDWGQVTGDTWPGVNNLPSAWRNGRVSDYSDRAALLLTLADPGGAPGTRAPLFLEGKFLKKYLSLANNEDGPKKNLKVALVRLSRVFLDIGLLKRQLMAATCLKPSRTSSSQGHTTYRRRRSIFIIGKWQIFLKKFSFRK